MKNTRVPRMFDGFWCPPAAKVLACMILSAWTAIGADPVHKYKSAAKDGSTVTINYTGLTGAKKLSPGLYINVNWDDDDGDGWTLNELPPDAAYTPDKDDAHVSSATCAGDSDFRPFTLTHNPAPAAGKTVKLTFPAKIKVWKTRTKKDAAGNSSQVTSGTSYPMNDLTGTLYIEGVSGSASFRDVDLKAENGSGAFDTLKITVFEVTSVGVFAGAQPDEDECAVRHSDDDAKGSSDMNGKISWDDKDGDGVPEGAADMDANCEFFHNCMTHQGTVMPEEVVDEVSFAFYRDKYRRIWESDDGTTWGLFGQPTGWQDDGHDNHDDEDASPSGNDKIYQIDGPGIREKALALARAPYVTMFHCFRESVKVKIGGVEYQCSGFLKWHSRIQIKPKDAIDRTRDLPALQALGADWIAVPNNP